MSTRLVNYRGAKIDLAFPIEGPRVTIGREDDNMIQLPHEKVSKHHAAILQAGKRWLIEDLDSTSGVFVNDQSIQRRLLKDGDQVQIGPYEFFFETNVPSEDWVPSHILDLSTKVHEQTVHKTEPPTTSAR